MSKIILPIMIIFLILFAYLVKIENPAAYRIWCKIRYTTSSIVYLITSSDSKDENEKTIRRGSKLTKSMDHVEEMEEKRETKSSPQPEVHVR